MTRTAATLPDVTCLGCGCACDDIQLTVQGGRIAEAVNACPLGAAWFADGAAPSRALVGGRDATVERALTAAAELLCRARTPLIVLATDLTCEAQREGVALADLLRASLDTITSATALPSVIAAQERGRAGATLGEIANRADLIVWWGVDPDLTHPRFRARYGDRRWAPAAAAGSRTVVAVDVGRARGPVDVDQRYEVAPAEEVATLVVLRHAAAAASADGAMPAGGQTEAPFSARARALATVMRAAQYVVVVADAEPDQREPQRDSGRATALLAATQAFNEPTRCALVSLRGGGNRSGADAVLTWQTGYPAAVDFSRGYPRYRPFADAAQNADAVLILGAAADLPATTLTRLAPATTAVIGPRASTSALAGSTVVVDTAVAGIHESGFALRMDDVPLPLRECVGGPPATKAIAGALRERIVAVRTRVSAPEW